MSRAAAACLFAGLFCIAPAFAVPPDAKEQVEKLLPGGQVEVLPAGTWTVTEDFVPPSGSSTQPAHERQMTASYAIRLNDRVLLEEAGAGGGRCLWGGRDGPTKIHAGVVFPSFEQFIKETNYAPLPKAPSGFAIRQ